MLACQAPNDARTNRLDPTPAKSGRVVPARSSVSGFQPGLNSGSDLSTDVPIASRLGARLVRLAFQIGTPVSSIEPVVAAYAARGIRVNLMASFYASMPTSDQAK